MRNKLDLPAVLTIAGGALMVIGFWLAQLASAYKNGFFFAGLALGVGGFILRKWRKR